MVMPLNLIVVRHGESEGNDANRRSRKGDNSRFDNEEFRNRHSSMWRLTDTGVTQAIWAGEKIRAMRFNIGRKYTSPYFRAMETMGHMKLGGPLAMSSYELRERSWGEFDGLTHKERAVKFSEAIQKQKTEPFLWEPPGGEPLVVVVTRVRDLKGTLHRECGDMESVVMSCHGETAEVIRATTERMTPQQFVEMKQDPAQDMWNCAILHYTRKNPHKPEAEPMPYLNWVRLVTPPDAHNHGAVGFDWKEIKRPRFTDEELLQYVERYAPRIQY